MYAIALIDFKGDYIAPKLVGGNIYTIIKEDEKHYFIESTNSENKIGMYGFFKEKFKVLKGDEKTIKLLYSKGKHDNL